MSAESTLGSGMMSGFSGSTSTSPSWWDVNGGNTIAGIGATVGSIFQALPGLIAAGQGADVVYSPTPNSPTGPQYIQQPAAQNNSSTLIWVVVIAVLVILLIAAGIYFSKTSAK